MQNTEGGERERFATVELNYVEMPMNQSESFKQLRNVYKNMAVKNSHTFLSAPGEIFVICNAAFGKVVLIRWR